MMEYLIAGCVAAGLIVAGVAGIRLASSTSFTGRIDRRRRAQQRFLQSWWTDSTNEPRNGG
jgi:hypothetical protein